MKEIDDMFAAFRTWAREVYDRHTEKFHFWHGSAHATYFFLAFLEGHGMYAYMSGVLFLVSIVALAINGEGDVS